MVKLLRFGLRDDGKTRPVQVVLTHLEYIREEV